MYSGRRGSRRGSSSCRSSAATAPGADPAAGGPTPGAAEVVPSPTLRASAGSELLRRHRRPGPCSQVLSIVELRRQPEELGVPFDGFRQHVRRQAACMEMVHQLIGRRPVDGCHLRRGAHERDDMLAPQATSFLGDLVGEAQVDHGMQSHAIPQDRDAQGVSACGASLRKITPSRTRRLSAVGCRLPAEVAEVERPLRGESDARRTPCLSGRADARGGLPRRRAAVE